ncbi:MULTISPECIES: PhzF family phenazine biosynthesis protein [Xanthomonas]|uniref:Phenazine biosynthesis protein PhzF family n=1 Tax=Xanthomonas phaseoli pv. dieffenbachiae TaxID=92828 RepID=A0A1V9GVG4_9XANT|nr:PhzF family phenazine biosynthesis protein [Xanthomonas phaseoli]MBO9767593.1 PhzF family phenazine biosynthesis protein [Xanthomonas phaseoli pv. dieffenbachiae]MBO9775454.1 PhzF family phenazine biosynthesis protein [Xanthomonas phaseoli pv. dieffenbachiae]MBO9781251.1 PhzF family phenazine biosynthesis protein [Xanthomonas phaseoli pv. dieffenbachiae]MBO9786868.1 PhzF family phenazine biosynthesis protein [Xanthomonas phaseoli pv. dieffenbachiae]MBO9794464.1 PhzF family phenazine biosynt
MTTRRFLQLDVFSARPGSGNPLAVVLDAQGLDDAAMQAIARWTKLPETTFVFPAEGAHSSYRLRMFSPQKEVPFAGHPSVGTAHAVLEAGLAAPQDGVLVQDGIAGRLPLRVEQRGSHRSIAIRTPRARVAEQVNADDPRLRDALQGWPLGTLPPALMDGGRTWWVVELASEAALRGLQPDWDAIAGLAESTGSMGVFAYARANAPGTYDLAVRAFVGNGRRFEDAASGAANAVLAAWLDSRDALPGTDRRYVVSQGREIGFDALLELNIDADGDVWSGGQVQTVIRGTLDWA